MHIPERSCIGCRTKNAKRQFLRLCRCPDGTLVFDPTGKAPGRGAYVCANEKCIQKALHVKTLSRAFRLTKPVPLEEIETLKHALLRRVSQE